MITFCLIYFGIGVLMALWSLFDCKDIYLEDDKPIYNAICWATLAFLLWPLMIAGAICMLIIRGNN